MAGRRARAGGSSDGFAAADALIALVILSTTIVLALGAVQTARRTAGAAAEVRRAESQLRYLVDSTPRTLGTRAGAAAGFDWRVDLKRSAQAASTPAVQLCDVAASLHALSSGRRYRLTTSEICSAQAQS